MTKADQCKAILAEFAQRSGLVRESACGKRKRADLDEVRKHLERLQAIVDALQMHTGMVDLDDILKGLPALVASQKKEHGKRRRQGRSTSVQ